MGNRSSALVFLFFTLEKEELEQRKVPFFQFMCVHAQYTYSEYHSYGNGNCPWNRFCPISSFFAVGKKPERGSQFIVRPFRMRYTLVSSTISIQEKTGEGMKYETSWMSHLLEYRLFKTWGLGFLWKHFIFYPIRLFHTYTLLTIILVPLTTDCNLQSIWYSRRKDL